MTTTWPSACRTTVFKPVKLLLPGDKDNPLFASMSKCLLAINKKRGRGEKIKPLRYRKMTRARKVYRYIFFFTLAKLLRFSMCQVRVMMWYIRCLAICVNLIGYFYIIQKVYMKHIFCSTYFLDFQMLITLFICTLEGRTVMSFLPNDCFYHSNSSPHSLLCLIWVCICIVNVSCLP